MGLFFPIASTTSKVTLKRISAPLTLVRCKAAINRQGHTNHKT